MSREWRAKGEEKQSEAKIPGAVGSWKVWQGAVGRLKNLCISLKLLGNTGEAYTVVVPKEMEVIHNS